MKSANRSISSSPCPLSTHPIMDNVMWFLMWDNFSSKIFTVSITWKPCLAHDGQEIILTPLFLKLSDYSISFPICTSLTVSSDKEILIVSPIPLRSSDPTPIEDFMLPDTKPPASVTPRWRG